MADSGAHDRHPTYAQARRVRSDSWLFIDLLTAGPELTLIARRTEHERLKVMAAEALRQSLLLQQQQTQQQEPQPHYTHER